MANDPSNFKTKDFSPLDAIIQLGQNESSVVAVYGATSVGMFVPAGMTGISIGFSCSYDGVNFSLLADINDVLIVQRINASARSYALSPQVFFPWNYIKLISSANEAAQRTIKIMPGCI